MSFIADFHMHSRYSRATSRDCNLEGLWVWAQLKGVRVVGTGDFTHPAWIEEVAEKLEPAPDAPGLHRLRDEITRPLEQEVPGKCRSPVYFMLTGEISHIYRRDGRVRKVHTLLAAPDLDTVRHLAQRLEQIGNIRSDGRPILGLDPRDLLEICLEINPDILFIPAHIWTPWFSMLGSKSGFDSMEECFGRLTRYIVAVETGLSSDPPMNWRVSFLDNVALVSNSDLHSPSRLGRNANIFHCPPGYFHMRQALESRDPERYGGTLDLFPEEGKYHLDGHRKCGVSMEPEEALARDCLCPVCGKPLVLGVLHRVVALADRPKGARPPGALPCEHIIPLPEILAELFECGANTKRVDTAYRRLLHDLGPEFVILRQLPIEEIESHGPALLGEAVRRVREERVIRKGGYDGLYGEIHVFEPGEKERLRREAVLISLPRGAPPPARTIEPEPPGPAAAEPASTAYVLRELRSTYSPEPAAAGALQPSLFPIAPEESILDGLTEEQRAAVTCEQTPVLVAAGPGAGKTAVLTRRVQWLVQARGAAPERILAVTFTNRAANEMRERLQRLLPEAARKRLRISTFHAFCLELLRECRQQMELPPGFHLVDADQGAAVLADAMNISRTDAQRNIESLCTSLAALEDPPADSDAAATRTRLHEAGFVLLDELVPTAVRLFDSDPAIRSRTGLERVCVDEFQDVNPAQFELVRRLCPDGRGLFAIGDPDQAIYGFRGADPRFILEFDRFFPGTRIIRLTRNFRSDGAVVQAASAVIGENRSRISVRQAPAFEVAVPVRLYEAPTPAAEAEFITHEIERWMGGVAHFSVDSGRIDAGQDSGAVTFGDIAVLVRLHVLVQPLAEALQRLGLPVHLPAAGNRDVRRALRIIGAFAAQLPPDSRTRRAGEIAGLLLDNREGPSSGLPDFPAVPEEITASLRELLDLAPPGTSESFETWLQRVALEGEADRLDAGGERVTVCSIHAAKGLEFPIVFLAACEQGVLPYIPPGRSAPERPEEERRLLYVAATRARRVLYITAARRRTLYGKSTKTGFSPFLEAFPQDAPWIERVERTGPKRPRPTARQLTFDF